jgi:hypothetical protein
MHFAYSLGNAAAYPRRRGVSPFSPRVVARVRAGHGAWLKRGPARRTEIDKRLDATHSPNRIHGRRSLQSPQRRFRYDRFRARLRE